MAQRVLRPAASLSPRPHPRRVLSFDAEAITHNGAVRDHNEDFAYAGEVLVAVADGVGGQVYGEVASELAIEAVSYLDDRVFLKEPDAELREATLYANVRVSEAIGRDRSLAGMATTLTALRLDGPSVVVAQVGDSRAYRLRDASLEQLTRDDSLVQQLLDEGVITPQQARTHPHRSVVLQAVAGGALRPTIDVLDAEAGDRYLVCSDGLSDYVEPGTLAELLRTRDSRPDCCAALLEAALEQGAPDNVTCVVADVRPYVADGGS